MKHLLFSKYHGLGNDFILIDDRTEKFSCDKELIKKICHRNLGIGADGLILMQTSPLANIKMRIFNKDGSEAESCGNGLCSLLSFYKMLGYEKDQCTIEIKNSLVKGSFLKDRVAIEIQDPKIFEKEILIKCEKDTFKITYLNSGVPHIVTFVKDLENIDLLKQGRNLRFHEHFQPNGTNVNFAELKNNLIKVRTYERGVEDETHSCGTGAIAVAVAAILIHKIKSPISVEYKYGRLEILFESQNEFITNVKLINQIKFVCSGIYLVD